MHLFFFSKYTNTHIHSFPCLNILCMHTYTVGKCKKNKLFIHVPHAIVSNGRPMQEIELLNSMIILIPKAPPSQRSSTAPPTNSTSTFFLTLACLQLDSGWNTKVSKNAVVLDVKYKHPEDKY